MSSGEHTITVRQIIDLDRERAVVIPADGHIVEIQGPNRMKITVELTGDTIEIRSSEHSRLLFTSEGSNGLRIKPSWESL